MGLTSHIQPLLCILGLLEFLQRMCVTLMKSKICTRTGLRHSGNRAPKSSFLKGVLMQKHLELLTEVAPAEPAGTAWPSLHAHSECWPGRRTYPPRSLSLLSSVSGPRPPHHGHSFRSGPLTAHRSHSLVPATIQSPESTPMGHSLINSHQ